MEKKEQAQENKEEQRQRKRVLDAISTQELTDMVRQRQSMVWPVGWQTRPPGMLRQAKRLCTGLVELVHAHGPAPMEIKEGKSLVVVPRSSLAQLDTSAMLPILPYLGWRDLMHWLIARGRQYGLNRDYLEELLRFQKRHVFTNKDFHLLQSPVLMTLAKELRHIAQTWEFVNVDHLPELEVMNEMMRATHLTTVVFDTIHYVDDKILLSLGWANHLRRLELAMPGDLFQNNQYVKSIFRNKSKAKLQTLHLLLHSSVPDSAVAYIASECPELQIVSIFGEWSPTGLRAWSKVPHPWLRKLVFGIGQVKPGDWISVEDVKSLFLQSPLLSHLEFSEDIWGERIEWMVEDHSAMELVAAEHFPSPASFVWNFRMYVRRIGQPEQVLQLIVASGKTQWNSLDVHVTDYRRFLELLLEQAWILNKLVIQSSPDILEWKDEKIPWLTSLELKDVLTMLQRKKGGEQELKLHIFHNARNRGLLLNYSPSRSGWEVEFSGLDFPSVQTVLQVLSNQVVDIDVNGSWIEEDAHHYADTKLLHVLMDTQNRTGLTHFMLGRPWALTDNIPGGKEEVLVWDRIWSAQDVERFFERNPNLQQFFLNSRSIRRSPTLFQTLGSVRSLGGFQIQLVESEVSSKDFDRLTNKEDIHLRSRLSSDGKKIGSVSEAKDRLDVQSMKRLWEQNRQLDSLALDLWPSPFVDIDAMFGPSALTSPSALTKLWLTRPQEDPVDAETMDALLQAHPQLELLVIGTGHMFWEQDNLSYVTVLEGQAWKERWKALRVQVLQAPAGEYGKHSAFSLSDDKCLAGQTTSRYRRKVPISAIRLPEEMLVDKYEFETKMDMKELADVSIWEYKSWFEKVASPRDKISAEITQGYGYKLDFSTYSEEPSKRFTVCPELPDDGDTYVYLIDHQAKTIDYIHFEESVRSNAQHLGKWQAAVDKYFSDYQTIDAMEWLPASWYKFPSPASTPWAQLLTSICVHLILLNPDVPRRDVLGAWLHGHSEEVQKRTLMFAHHIREELLATLSLPQDVLGATEPMLDVASSASARTSLASFHPQETQSVAIVKPMTLEEKVQRPFLVDKTRSLPFSLPPDTAPILQEWVHALHSQMQHERASHEQTWVSQEVGKQVEEWDAKISQEIERKLDWEFRQAATQDRQRKDATRMAKQLLHAIQNNQAWTCPDSFLFGGRISKFAFQPPNRIVYELALHDERSKVVNDLFCAFVKSWPRPLLLIRKRPRLATSRV